MHLHRFPAFRRPAAILAVTALARTALALDDGAPANAPQMTDTRTPVVVEENLRPPLLIAAMRRDWKEVGKLLADGTDPNVAGENQLTPLMAAAIAGHVPTIEALLAAGARPDLLDARSRTALGYAVALRQMPAVEVLLAHQPELPAADQGGDDLAAAALAGEDAKLIETVLRRIPGGLTWTPAARLAFAKALAARDTLLGPLFLAKYAGPAASAENAEPLLAYAIARGDVEQARTLLDFGADPNTTLDQSGDADFRSVVSSSTLKYYLTNTKGLSVLMLAAGLKQTECVKLLLERGANRFAATKGKSQLIALYFAAWADAAETLQALIKDAPSRDDLWIEISLDEQRARFFRDGQLVLNSAISTGRAGFATKPGEYVITDKNREHRSSIYHEASMPYFMRLSCADFGLHQGYVTGSPASHGCIRLPGAVAQRLFKEVPVGTWVTIKRTAKGRETASTDQPSPRR